MRILQRICVIILSIVVTLALVDTALQFTHYKDLIAKYAFPMNYYETVPGIGRDIKPDQPISLVPFFDEPYYTWANEIGCFDTSINDLKPGMPFIYLTGDSFTWGFAPFQDKWGTIMQQELGIRILKCGVPGYGTKLELLKTEYDLAKFPTAPKLIIVGYFNNDPFDDSVSDPGLQLPVCEVAGFPIQCWLTTNWLYNNSVLYNAFLGLLNKYLNPPDLAPTPQMYATNFANLNAFQSYARSSDSRLLVVMIPPVNSTVTGKTAYGPQDQYMQEHDIPYVDMTDAMHQYYEPGRAFYWHTNPHLNVLGNELMGYLLSQYTIENGIVNVSDKTATLAQIGSQIQALFATSTAPTS